MIESNCEIARDFDMLFLVDPDGHVVRLIQQNIRRHQNGIVHEPHVDIIGMLLRFILKLRHAFHFADVGDGVEDPTQFGMRGHLRLNVKRTLFGIQPAGKIERGKFYGSAAQKRGVLPHGDGVHIRDRIKAIEVILHPHPITDRARKISDCEISARLNRRVHDFTFHIQSSV